MDRKKVAKSVLALLLMLALALQPLALAAPGEYYEVDDALEAYLPEEVPEAEEPEEEDEPADEIEAAATVLLEVVFETSDGYVETTEEHETFSHRDEIAEDHPALWAMIDRPSPILAARSGSGIPHLYAAYGVVRSGGTATGATMNIYRVRVLDGGANQNRWRDQVGAGESIVQYSDSPFWYTTSRAAALDDRRLFFIRTEIPSALAADLSTYSGNIEDRIDVTYGGAALDVWRNNPNFVGAAGGDLIELAGHSIIEVGGTHFLQTALQFNSPYATGNTINGPGGVDGGFRNFGQAGFPLGMRSVIGTFDIGINVDNGDLVGTMPLRLNLYDDFMQWYEINQWAQDLQAEAGTGKSINGRHVDVTTIGHSHMGRPIWNVAIAADQAAVDHYLNVTLPMMRNNPEELRRQVDAGTYGHRMPIYFTNIHPDEVAGICSQIVMMEQLIRNNTIFFEYATDTEEFWGNWPTWQNTQSGIRRTGSSLTGGGLNPGDTSTNRVEMNVADVLDDFIFLFCPTNNPDGREALRRVNAYGFDMNRDGSSQVHPENRYMIAEILRWSPIIQLDLHGHVASMLIEPCTGPHNPNYEYDLMNPMMVRLAHAMGLASIAGPYNRYMIPAEHMSEGWDDGGPLYLPVFMSHFGILGFTLEIPHANQESVDALVAKGWAAVHYAQNNFEEIVSNKTIQMERGVNNIDARDEVDPFFINPDTFTLGDPTIPADVVGRPRIYDPTHPQAVDGYLDFFPDWWVIPADDVRQHNRTEAYRGIELLLRNQIRVERLNQAVTHDGVTWPAGTFIVDMRQALRGAANTLLGYGYDASMFSDIYAGVLSAHPAARGFAATDIWAENLFTGRTTPVTSFSVPTTQLAAGSSTYLVIRNMAQDAILVVNDLLRAGTDVYMLTEFAQGGRVGDFVVARADLTGNAALTGRRIETTGYLNEVPDTAAALTSPTVGIHQFGPGAGQGGMHPTRYIVSRMLGFDVEWIQNTADVSSVVGSGDIDILVNVHPLTTTVNLPGHGNYDVDTTQGDFVLNSGIPFIQVGDIGVGTNVADPGMPGITITQNGARSVEHFFGAAGDRQGGMREGLFRGSFSNTSALTAHYDRNSVVHQYIARTYTTIPDGLVPLMQSDAGAWDDVFLGGWFHGAASQNVALDRILAFTGETTEGAPATLFGTMITRFAHIQMYHNLLGTAIFMHTSDIPTDVSRPFVVADTTEVANGLEVTLSWYGSEVAGNNATITEKWVNVSTEQHIPPFNPETAAADGWVLYDDASPILITEAFQVVHWFVVNSDDDTHQDYFIFGVPEIPGQPPQQGPGGGGIDQQPSEYVYHDAYMFGNANGEFRPRASTTRAEVAAILVRTMVEDFEYGAYPAGVTTFSSFSDVSPTNWFYWYIVWAHAEGLVQGFDDGTFRPNAPITRQEYAAMVARTGDVLDADDLNFDDADAIGNWAIDYVYTAFRNGWMVGDQNNNFRPSANILRAEVATATNRILGRVDSNAALVAANLQNPSAARSFPDVANNAWYFASVLGAANDHRNRIENEDIVWKYILVEAD